MQICFTEKSDKYKVVKHQMDVWHGSKGIIKKVNKVRKYNLINDDNETYIIYNKYYIIICLLACLQCAWCK